MDELAMLAASSSTLLLYALSVVASKIIWPWRGEAKGLLALCCHRLRSKTHEPEDSEVERKVREERLKRHVGRAYTFLLLSSVTTTFHCAYLLRGVADGKAAMGFREAAILQAFGLIQTTACFFPKMLTPKSIDGIYCLLIAVVNCITLLSGPELFLWRKIGPYLFWSLFDLKPWLNAVGALTLLIVDAAVVVRMGAPLQPLVLASAAYLFALLALIGIDYCLEQSVRFEIAASESKSELTAIQTLLNSICDVVVQLDGQLRLKQHSPKLADILLQPAARNLEGADLREYMVAEEDREAFSEYLCMKDGSAAQADVFHARLRDSTTSTVAMEFFAVGFKRYDGGQHHILGMRGHKDIQPLAHHQRREPPPPPAALDVVRHRSRHAKRRAQPPQLGREEGGGHRLDDELVNRCSCDFFL